tara:strand:+ start:4707 stop:4946 length:240 start_codon:yes stop_codon:yes gene_type:complete
MSRTNQNRKFVNPNQKSTDKQIGVKDGNMFCVKCDTEKSKTEFNASGGVAKQYWCKPCHNEYSRKRRLKYKPVSYNDLW